MLLWLPAACAAPADPAELADAADYARGVITACRVDPACPTSRDVLAEAFLAIALASAVLEGRPDPASSANARHLSPTLAARWDDLLVDGANPDPWVLQWTHTPEQPVSVEPMPEPPPRIDPQRFGGGAWLDVSASAGAGPRRLNLRNHHFGRVSVDLRIRSVVLAAEAEGHRSYLEYAELAQGASGWVGMGMQVGNRTFELQAALGPTYGTVDDPSTVSAASSMGLGLRGRVRSAVGPRVGFAVRQRSDFAIRSRGDVRLWSLVAEPELQVLLFSDLWLIGSAILQTTQSGPDLLDWNPAVGLAAGLRWRSQSP